MGIGAVNNIENSDVLAVYQSYPQPMQKMLLTLRRIIIETAEETEGIEHLEETLKWGEPSYRSKHGSTIRINWKPSRPNHYAMYFHCKTTLVETFRELYQGSFEFEGNRAIVFHDDDDIDVEKLKHCIALSLTYHRIKHLRLLGV